MSRAGDADWLAAVARWRDERQRLRDRRPGARRSRAAAPRRDGAIRRPARSARRRTMQSAVALARKVLAGAAPAGLAVLDGAAPSEVFVDVVRVPDFAIVLFGAGHVGRALVRVLAGLACRVQWIDTRDDAFPAGDSGQRRLRGHRRAGSRGRGGAAGRVFSGHDAQPSAGRGARRAHPRPRRFRVLRPDRLRVEAAPVRTAARGARHAALAFRRDDLPDRHRRHSRQGARGDRHRGRGGDAAGAQPRGGGTATQRAPHERRAKRRSRHGGSDDAIDSRARRAADAPRLAAARHPQGLSGRRRQRRHRPHGDAGRDPRGARRERRRQVDADEDHLRRDAADGRRDVLGGRGRSRPTIRRMRARSASGWCSSTSRCSRR